MSVISELRRRQVFRAAAWYGGLAWLAIEVANTVFPQFGLAEWSVRAVIVAALLGLPVAIALAWSFDLSAMGLRREASAPPAGTDSATTTGSATIPSAPLWRLPSFWIALALGAGLAVSAQQAWQRLILPVFGERPGIAVLPFANLSPDPENAFFADGLHEEILATLGRTSSLRVISRTSVQQYRDTQRNLREIADALDVSLILEGSVRREGDELRLTLQLIDGRTDAHLWAETYDRKFENALHLQRTVAQQIVASIGAQLTPAEDRLIERSAPADPEAYAFYLQALARWSQFDGLQELQLVEGLLDRAVELDPEFALGYALRAKVRVWIGTTTDGPHVEAARLGARRDFEHALALQPDLPEALVARASYITYVDRNAAAALSDLDRALELAPNDADAHSFAGLTLRRLGRFDEALDHFREAARLRPAEPPHSTRVFQTLDRLGRYAEAERQTRAFRQRFPTLRANAQLAGLRMRFMLTGEIAGWRAAYERLEPDVRGPREVRYGHFRYVCLATGDLADLAAYLEVADPSEFEPPSERAVQLALTYAALGDMQRARPHLESLVADMERARDDAPALSVGAVALVLLGRPDEAVPAADAAARLTPEAGDAVNGPTVALWRAWVLIRAGGDRADEGYAELARLLGQYNVQPREISIHQLGVMLRDDARAWGIITNAIEQAARRAIPAVTPPAPAVDPPP
jgi:TolB-like protein/Tfp pilus assembly protein PilF